MNFSKGILETRLVTYKHLKNLLRPVPLNTPTIIELGPGEEIRVTLIDANHCPGAVMFLIENSTNAVLYTGDIRSEPWWVNSIARHPYLLPYTFPLRQLDTVYLDTTFATKSNPYRDFSSKAEGLNELLSKIDKYPPDTIFHFNSWTFGYEDVWLGLCSFLKTKMHIDGYKLRLFRSLLAPKEGHAIPEAAALCGYKLGNAWHEGCLTEDIKTRLHGCELGHGCSVRSHPTTVRLVPIVNRLTSGEEVLELGGGRGHGDLAQWHELDLSDQNAAMNLLGLCADIKDDGERKRAVDLIMEGLQSRNRKISLPDANVLEESDEISLSTLTDILASSTQSSTGNHQAGPPSFRHRSKSGSELPMEIRFPYSRHSSYQELRHLIKTFAPADIHPCTVDESHWNPSLSMQSLFGDLCSADIFAHDQEMLATWSERLERLEPEPEGEDGDPRPQSSEHPEASQLTNSSQPPAFSEHGGPNRAITSDPVSSSDSPSVAYQTARQSARSPSPTQHLAPSETQGKRKRSPATQSTDGIPEMASSSPKAYIAVSQAAEERTGPWKEKEQVSQHSLADSAFASQESSLSETAQRRKIERRREAYEAAKGRGSVGWFEYSTIGQEAEEELG